MDKCYFLEIDWKQNNTKNQNMRHNSAEECRIFFLISIKPQKVILKTYTACIMQ